MYRIDNSSAATILPAPSATGAPGYWSGGDPGSGQAATIVDAEWLNMVQEEISHVIEEVGIPLNKADRTQLALALTKVNRWHLSQDTTFYVDPAGNDTHDGLTAGTAWQTLQHAYNYVRDYVDTRGFLVIIQLANGTHNNGVVADFPAGNVTFQGNVGNPALVIVNPPNGSCFLTRFGAHIRVTAVTMVATGAPQPQYGGWLSALISFAGSEIDFDNVVFGTTTDGHITARPGGKVSLSGNGISYAISGSAPWHVSSMGGYIAIATARVSFQSTVNFATAFCYETLAGSTVDASSCTFVGTATGKKYSLYGWCTCAGAANFPGNVAGSVDPSSGAMVI